jgi:hypothetical protein
MGMRLGTWNVICPYSAGLVMTVPKEIAKYKGVSKSFQISFVVHQ